MNREQTIAAAQVMLGAKWNDKGECVNVECLGGGLAPILVGTPLWQWNRYTYRLKPEPITSYEALSVAPKDTAELPAWLFDGAYCVNRKGEKVGPMVKSATAPGWCVKVSSHNLSARVYANNGKISHYPYGEDHPLDLVGPWQEPVIIITGPGHYMRADGKNQYISYQEGALWFGSTYGASFGFLWSADGTCTNCDEQDREAYRIVDNPQPVNPVIIDGPGLYERADGKVVDISKSIEYPDSAYCWHGFVKGSGYYYYNNQGQERDNRRPNMEILRKYVPKPWDCAEDVPVGCWIRKVGDWRQASLVTGVGSHGISTATGIIDYVDLGVVQYSTDRKTWKPCVKGPQPYKAESK